MNFKPLFLLPLIAPTLSMALSLQESIEEVIDTNPEYTERVRNFNVVREELYIAKSGYKPSVNLNSTYGSESINAPTTNNEDKSYTRSEIDLTISQNLFRGFGDKYEIARQTARLSSAGYSILEKANAIALEMAEAYLNVERNKKLLAVALQNSDSHDRVYSQIKERTDSGLGSRSEFEQAGSRLALAHSNYMTQLNAYEDSLTNFEKVYGALPDMEDFEESALSVTVPESYDDAKELVETNNPTLLLHGYNFKAAQDNYAATKQNYLPVIDLEVKKGISENVSGIEGKNENLSGIVRLTYNFYNGGADQANRQKGISLMHQESDLRASTQRNVNQTLRLSWKKLEILERQMKFFSQHAELSKSTVDSYNEEFKLGRRNLLDLLIAESEYNGARQAKVNGEYDRLLAKIRISNVLGSLLESFDIEILDQLGLDGDSEIEIEKDSEDID